MPEPDLEPHIFLPANQYAQNQILKTVGHPTLLDLLGYLRDEVEDHPTMTAQNGTVRIIPDYVLRVDKVVVAVLELKAPSINIALDSFTQQIISYCLQTNAPLGFLFNGTSLRVFVNTNYNGFARQRALFTTEPVLSIHTGNTDELATAFYKLTRPDSVHHAVEMGRRLASDQKRQLESKERRKEIGKILKECFNNPTDELFDCLSGMNTAWSGMKVNPTAAEIKAIWKP